jgi:hypothetical protein
LAAEPTPIRPVAAVPSLPQVSADAGALLRWALAVPMLAVLAVGVLYGVGAALKAGQLSEAGLSPIDLLPTVPFGQLVTLGVEAAVAALALTPLAVLVAYLAGRALQGAARMRSLDDAVGKLVADHDQLRKEVRQTPDADVAEHFERRLRRLETRAARVRESGRRRRGLTAAALAVAVVVLLFAASPLELAAAAVAVVLVSRYRWHAGFAIATVFCMLLLAVVAERSSSPDPIPDASVRTMQGHLVEGRLVAATPRAWYVDVGAGRVRSVPTVRIARSTIRSHESPGAKSLGGRVFDVFG